MNILIVSPGKKHSPEMAVMIGEYEKRLRGRFDLSWRFISAGDEKDESMTILKSIVDGDLVILLDENGIAQTSVQFSQTLSKAVTDGAKRIVFVVGGAYGVTDSVRLRAQKIDLPLCDDFASCDRQAFSRRTDL